MLKNRKWLGPAKGEIASSLLFFPHELNFQVVKRALRLVDLCYLDSLVSVSDFAIPCSTVADDNRTASMGMVSCSCS